MDIQVINIKEIVDTLVWLSSPVVAGITVAVINKYMPKKQRENLVSETYKNMLQSASQSIEIMKTTIDELKASDTKKTKKIEQLEKKVRNQEVKINKEVASRKDCLKIVNALAKKNGVDMKKIRAMV